MSTTAINPSTVNGHSSRLARVVQAKKSSKTKSMEKRRPLIQRNNPQVGFTCPKWIVEKLSRLAYAWGLSKSEVIQYLVAAQDDESGRPHDLLEVLDEPNEGGQDA